MNKTDTNLCSLYSTERDKINVMSRYCVWDIRAAKGKGGNIKQSKERRRAWVGHSGVQFYFIFFNF